MAEEKDIELKQLEGFTGTEKYYVVLGANVTDGIHYIMDNGYAWLVTDMLSVIKFGIDEYPKLKGQHFLAIKLKVTGKEAKATIDDGNENVLYTQEYKWTDAKKDLVLYFIDNVLMLSSEY